MASSDGGLLEPGTLVRTRAYGSIGTVMPYDMIYCPERLFPVLFHKTGVTRQMASDELDILTTTEETQQSGIA